MRKSRLVALVALLGLVIFAPGRAFATDDNDESQTYTLLMPVPNEAKSADGDMLMLMGTATLTVHPKSFNGTGSFVLTNDGATMTGTWHGTGELLAFQPYGCGVVMGQPLPSFACGGFSQEPIVLVPTAGPQMDGILRVICIIGDVPGQYFVSKNATEGVTLNLPGFENYNQPEEGGNVYIFTGGEPG
jgi:hypothetical protein